MPASPPSSLMVRLPNPLGDAVMALPLLSHLKRQFPDCSLTLAGNPAYESLFDGLVYVDHFIGLDNGATIAQQAKLLKQPQCDTIILCPNSWSSAMVAYRAGFKQRIGRRRHGRSLLLTHALPAIGEPRLMTELYSELIEAFNCNADVTPVSLPCPELDVEWAPNQANYFMVAPGAAFGETKQYPLPLMAQAIDGICDRHSLLPILFGAPREQQSLTELSQSLKHSSLIAPSSASLGEIKDMISNARFILCMDSGARHIAAAVDTPQIVVFGPTNPAWTAHAMDKAAFISNSTLDCLGCQKKICPIQGHPCMNNLDPQILVDASSRFIA
jgi:heptosyltransferase-2